MRLGSVRGTPRRGSSPTDSEDSDFGTRSTKRRKVAKTSQKSKAIDIVLPAERQSSRTLSKVVNYHEDDDDIVDEDDLMPNEFGEVWTYGI